MAKSTNGLFRYRYEAAEFILRRGGSDKEIQEFVLKEFPDSKDNSLRARKYRSCFEKLDHCRLQEMGSNRTKVQKAT